jgi:hypothetical protein
VTLFPSETLILIGGPIGTAIREKGSTIYQKRWKVEEYHKSAKSNTSYAKSPAHRVGSQLNHLFCSIIADVKLEVHQIATKKNHFAQKAQLYHAASIAAYEKLKEVNATCPKLAIIF